MELAAIILLAIFAVGACIILFRLTVAKQAIEQELAKARTQILQLQATIEIIEEVAEVGTWEIDVVSGKLRWSDRVFEIHGRPITKGTPVLEDAIHYFHPADRQRVEMLVEQAMLNGEDYEFRARLIDERGETRQVLSRAMIRFEKGCATGVFGAFIELADDCRGCMREAA